ncbi:HAD family hydrolase [Micromonospora echinaurantiaca]|uniref:HAD family hydrolase n=1 Tax=Micromonospora echinaurantiaca TaxID=47857 RepID=UPI0037968CE1
MSQVRILPGAPGHSLDQRSLFGLPGLPCPLRARTPRYLRPGSTRSAAVTEEPAHAEATLRALDLAVDVVGTSHGWGVAKPSPAFFEHVIREGGGDASSTLYVGDRPDNDARPAKKPV